MPDSPSPAIAVTDRCQRYGPWALVTGASDGIGRACAEQLAAEGFNLLLVARRDHKLEALAHQLGREHHIACATLAADLGTTDGVALAIAAAANHDIGLMVAAAGFGTAGAFVGIEPAEELAMIDVNCRAVVALTHALARQMQRNRSGRRSALVLLSSLVAFQGVPRSATYAASKAFVQVLAEGLRPELAALGIDVLAVAPGPVHSGFAARAGMTMGFAQTPAQVARGALSALGRTGTIRPGWLAKLLEYSLALLPRTGRTRIMGLVMAGMKR